MSDKSNKKWQNGRGRPKIGNHPNFKSGRTIASNGYVLVFKGVKHHLSDSRGYAYEHRLVMEEKLGRRLKKGEQVHHIDHDTKNNNPENLMLMESLREHKFFHRKTTDKRGVKEENPMVACECGCGETFKKYDKYNRPRKYIHGHNNSKP